MGTREVWQSTDRTSRGGAGLDGVGSRRRVREFLCRPDELRTLTTGEAFVWSTLGPAPERVRVTQALLPALDRQLVDTGPLYAPCGPTSLSEAASTDVAEGDEYTPSGEVPDVLDEAV